MARLGAVIILTLAMGLPAAALAQNLDIERDHASTFDDPGKPSRGMTQESVIATFGDPQSIVDPVGDPPISRWEYAGFTVFFEYDRVIHAVSRR